MAWLQKCKYGGSVTVFGRDLGQQTIILVIKANGDLIARGMHDNERKMTKSKPTVEVEGLEEIVLFLASL